MQGCLRKCIKLKPVQFIPQKWQQSIGQICHSCNNKITNQQCISACKCYLFCHEQCFLKQYSPYIFDNLKVICIRCHEQVTFQFTYIKKWQFNTKPMFVGSLVLSIILLIVLLGLLASGAAQAWLSDAAGYTIFVIGILLVIGVSLYGNRKSYIDLSKLKINNTNMMVTSQNFSHKNYSEDLKKLPDNVQSEKGLQFDIM